MGDTFLHAGSYSNPPPPHFPRIRGAEQYQYHVPDYFGLGLNIGSGIDPYAALQYVPLSPYGPSVPFVQVTQKQKRERARKPILCLSSYLFLSLTRLTSSLHLILCTICTI